MFSDIIFIVMTLFPSRRCVELMVLLD